MRHTLIAVSFILVAVQYGVVSSANDDDIYEERQTLDGPIWEDRKYFTAIGGDDIEKKPVVDFSQEPDPTSDVLDGFELAQAVPGYFFFQRLPGVVPGAFTDDTAKVNAWSQEQGNILYAYAPNADLAVGLLGAGVYAAGAGYDPAGEEVVSFREAMEFINFGHEFNSGPEDGRCGVLGEPELNTPQFYNFERWDPETREIVESFEFEESILAPGVSETRRTEFGGQRLIIETNRFGAITNLFDGILSSTTRTNEIDVIDNGTRVFTANTTTEFDEPFPFSFWGTHCEDDWLAIDTMVTIDTDSQTFPEEITNDPVNGISDFRANVITDMHLPITANGQTYYIDRIVSLGDSETAVLESFSHIEDNPLEMRGRTYRQSSYSAGDGNSEDLTEPRQYRVGVRFRF